MSSLRRCVSVIGAITLAAGMATVFGPGASSDAGTLTTHTVTNTGRGYVSKTVYPNGDVLQIYSATPVVLSTPRVTTAAASADGRTVHSESGIATPDLSAVPRVNGKPQLMATPSAYQEVLAMGASASVAAKFRQLDKLPASLAAKARIAPNAAVSPNSIIDDDNCVSKSSDGNRIKLYGCDTTTKVGSSGSVWYLEDNFLATGTAHDTAIFDPDNITGVKFGVSYGSGNKMTHWSPASTVDEGNCTSNTVSVTYDGVGASSTDTECPETFGVYTINTTQFTAKWDGQGSGPSNGSRDSHGVDSVYNGTSANPYPSLVWEYWWS